jgi:hypothetical protein
MTDPNEIAALKASFRGALSTAESLAALTDRIESLQATGEIGADDLEELSRVAAAHAIASAALRGLVGTMRARRGVEAAAKREQAAGSEQD